MPCIVWVLPCFLQKYLKKCTYDCIGMDGTQVNEKVSIHMNKCRIPCVHSIYYVLINQQLTIDVMLLPQVVYFRQATMINSSFNFEKGYNKTTFCCILKKRQLYGWSSVKHSLSYSVKHPLDPFKFENGCKHLSKHNDVTKLWYINTVVLSSINHWHPLCLFLISVYFQRVSDVWNRAFYRPNR